jgi:hypothetical protein
MKREKIINLIYKLGIESQQQMDKYDRELNEIRLTVELDVDDQTKLELMSSVHERLNDGVEAVMDDVAILVDESRIAV